MKYDDDELNGEYILFDELLFDPEHKVKDALMIEISNNHRLYYQIHEGQIQNGFQFCSVEFVSASGDTDIWIDPSLEVDRVSHGVALFDGIRHLYIPYWHYASMQELTKLANVLSDLVKKHCQNPIL